MIKLLLSIRSLDLGGAERQFVELVKGIDKNRFDVTVCTMYGGVLENEIKNIEGIEYVNLEKNGRYDIGFYRKYKRFLHELHPDVIYSFLGEMNLFSLWCKPKDSKLIWGFRASNKDFKQYGKISQLLFWLQKKYSSQIDKIIANSNASIDFHRKSGFYMDKAIVIPNGIDIKRFQRNEKYRKEFRKKHNLRPEDIALGIVARFDVIKGYLLLAKAMKRIFDEYDNIYFFATGAGDESIKAKCNEILGEYNHKKWFWLGTTKTPEKIYAGLDIYVSSSLGEGFSNSIAEAMACEVPCIVTDVGDSRYIVADTGMVVKPNDIEELYQGIKKLTSRKNDIKTLGKRARERVMKNFSIGSMVKQTENEILLTVEEKN